MIENKKAYCKYVHGNADDSGSEALKLFLPVKDGYVNYNIVHSVQKSSNCDTWRLSAAYHCDDKLSPSKQLTRQGAEWEMALKIQNRPDFVGGYAHGDEVYNKIELTIDGEKREICSLVEPIAFKNLSVEVWSKGYDPLDSITEALLHYKKIDVDENCVRVSQKVEWLKDYELGRSYMAMFPPFKEFTDSYYTNVDLDKKPIRLAKDISGSEKGLDTICLCGESGFTFSMQVEKYLTDSENGNTFLISDNGGVPYNKMYFPLCHIGCVETGEVWETVTVYTIKKK